MSFSTLLTNTARAAAFAALTTSSDLRAQAVPVEKAAPGVPVAAETEATKTPPTVLKKYAEKGDMKGFVDAINYRLEYGYGKGYDKENINDKRAVVEKILQGIGQSKGVKALENQGLDLKQLQPLVALIKEVGIPNIEKRYRPIAEQLAAEPKKEGEGPAKKPDTLIVREKDLRYLSDYAADKDIAGLVKAVKDRIEIKTYDGLKRSDEYIANRLLQGIGEAKGIDELVKLGLKIEDLKPLAELIQKVGIDKIKGQYKDTANRLLATLEPKKEEVK